MLTSSPGLARLRTARRSSWMLVKSHTLSGASRLFSCVAFHIGVSSSSSTSTISESSTLRRFAGRSSYPEICDGATTVTIESRVRFVGSMRTL
jgi:hypothetical protein